MSTPAPPPRRERTPRDVNARHRANIVIGAVLVVALLVAGFLVYRAVRPDADGGDATFNRVVTLDVERGVVQVRDADGDELDDHRAQGGQRLFPANGRFVPVIGDEVSIVDIDSGERTATDARDDDRLRWFGEDEPVLASYSAQGGDLLLTQAATGEKIDVADELDTDGLVIGDALFADADGEVFAISDAGSGPETTSVVVGFGRETIRTTSARGGVGAITDDQFVVFEHTGEGRGKLTFRSLDGGEQVATLDGVAAPVTSPLVDGNTITYLDGDGRLWRVSAGADEPDRIGAIELQGASLERPIALVDVIVAHTDAGELVVVDSEANEIGRVDGSLEPRSLGAAGFGPFTKRECLIVETGDGLTQYRLEDFARLTRRAVEGRLIEATRDGCAFTVSSPGGGALVAEGTVTELEDSTSPAAVAPDASAMLVSTRQGLELRRLDEPDAEPVDLGRGPGVFASV